MPSVGNTSVARWFLSSALLGITVSTVLLGPAYADPATDAVRFPRQVVGGLFELGRAGVPGGFTYLIRASEGAILISSGYPETLRDPQPLRKLSLIREQMLQIGVQPKDVRFLLITHAHPEHIGGHADLRRESGARVLVMAGDDETVRSGIWDRNGVKISVTTPCPVDEVLHDGSVLQLGGVRLTAHHTPGHTPGGTTWEVQVPNGSRTSRVLILDSALPFTNPLLFDDKSDPFRGEASLRGALGTLRRLRTLAPDVDVVLGYFDPESQMNGALPFLDYLTRKRLELLEQIQIQAMRATDPEEWERWRAQLRTEQLGAVEYWKRAEQP